MKKKIIKVNFCKFWNGFNYSNNFLLDALSKNYDVLISDDPDYIFFSPFSDDLYKYKSDCIRIYYTAENINPNFNICDYAIGFQYITYEDRYLRLPIWSFKHRQITRPLDESLFDREFCSFVVSEANAADFRTMFYNKLSEYKKIASGGKYLNNIGYRVNDKIEFCKNYKFNIAFENSSSHGYATEKIMDAFEANSIPIYWGDPCIINDINEKAFINCNKYSNIDDIVSKVIEVNENKDLYLSMLNENPFTKEGKKYINGNNLDTFLSYIMEQNKKDALRRGFDMYWQGLDDYKNKKYYEYEKIKKNPILNRIVSYYIKSKND